MFTWTKLPDVTFENNDIALFRLDPNPTSWWHYVEEGEPDKELESFLAREADVLAFTP